MSHVEDFYRASHHECSLNGKTFPAASWIHQRAGMEASEEVAEIGQMSVPKGQIPETKRLMQLLHPIQRAWERHSAGESPIVEKCFTRGVDLRIRRST
jgi:hypothetical protein